MPVQMVSYSMRRLSVRGHGSLLLDGLCGVMVCRRCSLLIDSPGSVLMDSLPCMAVGCLSDLALG